ncbi:MAG: GNAT family N-acetyltransferase [Rhizobiaceae bacterium]
MPHAAASGLPLVRRYEAAGFRAWPAARVRYDGTWVVRLTDRHPAKRLNSVNPLDPRDTARVAERIGAVGAEFDAAGRALTFRLSPLSGATLDGHLDAAGWSRFSESVVMDVAITPDLVQGAMDHIPLKEVGRFMDAVKPVHGLADAEADGLASVLASIRPNLGLFVLDRGAEPLATVVCVQDGDLAGLFEVATLEAERGMGHGRRAILAALRWARLAGARRAWLQVEADNHVAIGLYASLGFREVYRYHYRRPPETGA